MITFRKITAQSAGKLVAAYMREHQLEPTFDVRFDAGRDKHIEPGGRLTSYYTGREGRGAWRPDMGEHIRAALGIDISRPPSDQDLERLFEARRADDGELWSDKGRPRKLSGIDFTASPHKSVTLAAEFAQTPSEQAMIWQAIHIANDEAMRLIGSEIGWARKGDGGGGGAEAGEVGWVSFRHYTARPTVHIQDGKGGETTVVEVAMPGDPQAHIHNVVFNVVATEAGHVGSLDMKRVTSTTAHLYGAYFQAVLARELRALGIEVGYDSRNKAAVISAIPQAAVDLFSKGRRQVQRNAAAFAKRQGLDWDNLSAERKYTIMQTAGLALRKKKYNGKNDREIWRAQAEELDWHHRTVLGDTQQPMAAEDDRFERAYATASSLLAEEFRTAAQIDADMVRVHAAHGLIGSGIAGVRDIDRVAEMVMKRGIDIAGERVALLSGLGEEGRVRIATTAQIRIEEDLARLARYAATDRSMALPGTHIEAAIARSKLDFTREPEHGSAQLAAIRSLASAGRLSFLTGAAGAGKTTILKPLVDAWRHDTRFSAEGRHVIGVATAWRQAEALRETGMRETVALAPFLEAVRAGRIAPDRNTVLVVEEVSQIAPRPMLELLELQARTGMTVVGLGDRDQCQAIEAGDTIAVMRQALPAWAMPELLSTVRQHSQRQREIAALFRGNAADTGALTVKAQKEESVRRVERALAMKERDGTLMLAGGDHGQVVAAVADLYLRRRDHVRALGGTRGVTVSALTNDDVAEISTAIRVRLKERGEIGPDVGTYQAIDQRGTKYDLPLAEGDRVRLFRKVSVFADGKRTAVGANGDIVEILSVGPDTITMRNTAGESAVVPFDKLLDRQTGRLQLGHGHALTIDAAQGITSDEHINALPRGTAGATAFKMYVAESRHTQRAWTVIAEGAVREAVEHDRALGDQTPVTAKDLRDRIARDMAERPYKAIATDLVRTMQRDAERAAREWMRSEHAHQAAAADGRDTAAEIRARLQRERLQSALAKHLTQIDAAMARNISAARAATERAQEHLATLRARTLAAHTQLAEARVGRRAPSAGPGL